MANSSFIQYLGRAPGVLKLASLFYCVADPQTPWTVRAAGLFAAFYLIFPIDLIPDVLIFLLGLGVLDDVAILYMAYKMAESHIQPRHKQQALDLFGLTEQDLNN